MKTILALISILFLVYIDGYSQSNKLDKKLEKAYSLIKKDKLDDAADYINDLLKENPSYGDGWDLLVKIRMKQYENAKSTDVLSGTNFTITTKTKDGKDVKPGDDSLAVALAEMMTALSPSKVARKKYIDEARRATLYCNEAYFASYILRTIFVDPEIDTNVNKKALKYFNEAETEFQNKNYENAAQLYIRAIDKQPDFYKASLYLGDAYYFMGIYDKALKYFSEAVNKFPNMLEPRKYLIDTYAKLKLFNQSADEAIKALIVYPDLSVTEKLTDALYLSNKKLKINWTARGCFPNKVNAKEKIQKKNDSNIEIKEPWVQYKNALEKVKDVTDSKGIITKDNKITQTRYLELYSWEQMLINSNDSILKEARSMQKDGYLDCYVFITCFHIDIYDQYFDFATKNKEKITQYFKKYIE